MSTLLVSVFCFADGGSIPVTIPSPPPPPPTGATPHSLTTPIAQGYYDVDLMELHLTFQQSVGMCEISVLNCLTNELVEEVFDPEWGTLVIPLSGNPGLYWITLQTGNGTIYTSSFIL